MFKSPETPVSTFIIEFFNKINLQYTEGAITANEAVCKMYSIIKDNRIMIIHEYDLEKKAVENL